MNTVYMITSKIPSLFCLNFGEKLCTQEQHVILWEGSGKGADTRIDFHFLSHHGINGSILARIVIAQPVSSSSSTKYDVAYANKQTYSTFQFFILFYGGLSAPKCTLAMSRQVYCSTKAKKKNLDT